MEKLRGQYVWNIQVDNQKTNQASRTLTQMQPDWENLKAASEPQLFGVIH